MWIGQPLAGKTLLIHGEQGFGDFIQMCRYVPMIPCTEGHCGSAT